MDGPSLYYVFAIRTKRRWAAFLVIERKQLDDLRIGRGIGTEYEDKRTNKKYLKLTFSFTPDTVTCGGVSVQEYRNAWNNLPPLKSKNPLVE